MRFICNLLRDDQAVTAVEYAVMLAAIIVVAVAAITSVGGATGSMFTDIDMHMQSVGMGS